MSDNESVVDDKEAMNKRFSAILRRVESQRDEAIALCREIIDDLGKDDFGWLTCSAEFALTQLEAIKSKSLLRFYVDGTHPKFWDIIDREDGKVVDFVSKSADGGRNNAEGKALKLNLESA